MTIPPYWNTYFPSAEKFLHEDEDGYLTVFHQSAEYYENVHVVTALVPNDQLARALDFQGPVNAHVETSGDVYWSEKEFTPWLRVDLNNKSYEPFILGWQCGANYLSSAVIDPKFCMTYMLCPRLDRDEIIWDDRSKPEYRVVKQTLSNRYNWGSYDRVAEVKVRKDYIDRYLSLRKAGLVLLYSAQKNIELRDQDKVSRENQHYEENFSRGEGRLIYSPNKENPGIITTLSFAAVQKETSIRSQKEYESDKDLTWPGDTEVMTSQRAPNFQNTYEHAVVKDEVILEYQKDPDVTVDATSFVRYGGQWSLGFSRIGRDHLRVPIKELYQGVNTFTRNRWFDYAVDPNSITAEEHSNIGQRTNDIYESYKELCDTLHSVAFKLGEAINLPDLSGIDFKDVEYNGCFENEHINAISMYAPVNMGEDEFLKRCVDLHKFFEHMKPSKLKSILKALGANSQIVKNLQTNKLLQAILNVSQYADANGKAYSELEPEELSEIIEERNDMMAPLFRLYDLRLYGSHNKNKEDAEYSTLIGNYDANRQTREWGLVLDRVYDDLIEALQEIDQALNKPFEH